MVFYVGKNNCNELEIILWSYQGESNEHGCLLSHFFLQNTGFWLKFLYC